MPFELGVPQKSIKYSLAQKRSLENVFQRLLDENKTLRERLIKQNLELELTRWEMKKLRSDQFVPPKAVLSEPGNDHFPRNSIEFRKKVLEDAQRRKRDQISKLETQSVF